MGILLILSCNSYKIKSNTSNNNFIDNKTEQNEFNEINLSLYKDSLNNEGINEIINISKKNLNKNSPEGLLGNFITDLSLFEIRKKEEWYYFS
jgi:hypothetical protein